MEVWRPPPGFAPLIGAVQWPWCVGPGIGVSGPWSEWPHPVVVVVVGVVGPGMFGDGTCHHPEHLLPLLLFPRKRSSCLLLS